MPLDARRANTTAEKKWERLWATDDYEDDYYFVSQLFEFNWLPRDME